MKLEFYKLQASGNDFILIKNLKSTINTSQLIRFTKKYCSRKFGIGADGVLVVESSKKALFKMRIINPDGSEVEMCGNGARCVALWAAQHLSSGRTSAATNIRFETKAGIIEAKVARMPSHQVIKSSSHKNTVYKATGLQSCAQVAIKMVNPSGLSLVLPLKVKTRSMKVNFINTGVPHVVIFVQDLNNIDVQGIGRVIRLHRKFKPAGTNVNFVEFLRGNSIAIRTYERGVEAETLACGTGTVASAIISWFMAHGSWTPGKKIVRVKVKSADTLRVSFSINREKIENVWFEGKVYLVYKGYIEGQ